MITPEMTISFPAIFEAKLNMEGTKKQYSCCVLIDKSDKEGVKALKEAVEKAIAKGMAKMWGGKKPYFKNEPLRDGDEEIEKGIKTLPEHKDYQGKLFFSAYGNETPGVVDAQARPLMDQSKLYSGCIVRLDVNPYPFSNSGSNGVGWYLNNVMVVRDGKRLDGKQEATDAFAAFAQTDDSETGDDSLA